MPTEISAVILTFNEEDRIGELVRHLHWCDEVLIVDSQSQDRTTEIAEKRGATVVEVPRAGPGEPFDQFRQEGVDAASGNWILNLDVDERIPVRLKEELINHIDSESPEAIVEAPRSNYLGEMMLQGSGQWPDYEPILFRKHSLKFKSTPHNFQKYCSDDIRRLPADEEIAIQHRFAESMFDHWQNQRRYAKIGGEIRKFKFRHILSPPYAFYERFLKGKGYKDGWAGLGISLCWAWYQAETTFRSGIRSAKRYF